MPHDGTWMLREARPEVSPHRARFESLGVKLPERRLTTDELLARLRHHPHIELERLTGIRERRVCSPGEDSYTLALAAARDCLARSAHPASALDMVICPSITRYDGGPSYRFEPPFSLSIKEAIGAHRAQHLDLGNACAGMLTSVFLLDDLIRRGVIERGMVVSGENISGLGDNAAHDIRSVFSNQLASLTLGDAGAAVIVERAPPGTPGIVLAGFTTIAEHSRLCVGFPAPTRPGAQMFTEARAIHRVAMEDAPPLVEQMLEGSGLALRDIDWCIPHQTSARAIRAGEKTLAERFGGGPRHMVVNIEEMGNTASTTHFVALHRYLTEKRFAAGDKVMLLSLASGLEIGVIVLVMDELVETHGRSN